MAFYVLGVIINFRDDLSMIPCSCRKHKLRDNPSIAHVPIFLSSKPIHQDPRPEIHRKMVVLSSLRVGYGQDQKNKGHNAMRSKIVLLDFV